MMRFAMHMMVADSKKMLRGWTWFFMPLFFLFAICVPFIEDVHMYSMGYFLMMAIMLFRPQFSRIYHVLPLSIEQIRRLFFCRIWLFNGLLTLGGAIVILVSELAGWRWNDNGIGYLLFYMTGSMLCSCESLRSFRQKRHWTVWILPTIICIFSVLVAFADTFGMRPSIYKYLIGIIPVLLMHGYLLFFTKKLAFYDYVYVPNNIWNSSAAMQEEQP